jgi:hypothetical protein
LSNSSHKLSIPTQALNTTIAVDVITFDVNSLNVSSRSLATCATTKFRLIL